MSLLDKKCTPCEGGTPPLTKEQIAPLLSELSNEWNVVDGATLSRTFRFAHFKEALSFVNMVGELAETEGHHPDIHIRYNKVNIELSTHAIKGLSENDFIVARKIDVL